MIKRQYGDQSFLLLTSVSYVVIWQFFGMNFGRFDISKTRTSEIAQNSKQEIETKKSKQKKYEVRYWTVNNYLNFMQ